MTASNPQDLDRLFAEALNAGNLEALVALYEPQAAFTAEPGRVVVGSNAIRQALAGFLAAKPTISLKTRILAQTDDIALATADWELSGTSPDGSPMQLAGRSTEVCRRQADGRWLFVIDTPWGLE